MEGELKVPSRCGSKLLVAISGGSHMVMVQSGRENGSPGDRRLP